MNDRDIYLDDLARELLSDLAPALVTIACTALFVAGVCALAFGLASLG
jgi:hypothetical protein